MMETERTAKVELQDRQIEVRKPTAEQVMMLRRMTGDVKTRNMTAQEALQLLESSLLVVESIVVDSEDVIWINRQLMVGKLTLVEAASVVAQAIRKLWPDAKQPKDHAKKVTKAKLVRD